VDLAVIVEREADLPQVIRALCPPSRLTGCLDGREQKSDQHANDRDDDEQFDEGERPKSV
jgi:hypothetical protein